MKTLILLLLVICSVAWADESTLFVSDEPLEIEFELPLSTLLKNAADRPVVEGFAHYVDASGERVSLPVRMSTRGKSRLEVCRFPPLSLRVSRKNAKGTLFEGQKKLKIVTHCRGGARHRRYLFQEYSIYEAFNVLSDISFRTRFLDVTYRDSERPGRIITEAAFLIESTREVAARNGLERQRVGRVRATQLDPAYATLAALFNYLIGNTDWSAILGPGEDGCCHNGKVLSPPGEESGWFVVPYDFDQAGLINTNYAKPAEQLPIRSVRQRLYRGRCMHSDLIEAVASIFNERRDDIVAALTREGTGNPKSNIAYVDDFYRILNDPKRHKRAFGSSCVGD